MAHLKVKKHGDDFIAILDSYMPHRRETKKKLNKQIFDFMKSDEDNK